jgi:signal transduction histidine kinase
VLWTILPLTLVLIGVAFTGVYSHEQAMRDLVRERDQALATVSAAQIRDLLQTRASALELLAGEQVFHHQDLTGQLARLAEVGDLGLFIGSLALLDETGSPLATDITSSWMQDERVPDLACAVMARQEAILAPLTDPQKLALGIPVSDETGRTFGVLAGPVSFASLDLEGLLGQVQVGGSGVVYLVATSGEILASFPVEQARGSLVGHAGLEVALQDDSAGATLCHSPDGERMTLAYAPVDFAGIGWRVLIEEPWREVIGPVLRYSQFMPLVAVLAAVVSLLALYYGIRAIVRPLQALGQRAEQVAWGDFRATTKPVGGVQEIEDLRRTLDQMARRIESYQSGMHDYIAAITQGQEEERNRLARELHDDTAQALIALGQRVEMAQKLLPIDPGRAAERLVTVREMLAETLEGVRRFSRDLRPIYLEDLGFMPALEMLTRGDAKPQGLPVHLTTAGTVRRLRPSLELTAYRIVQEALNNVVQHAKATQAWVEVRFEADCLSISVRDDGQGFHAPDLPDTLARQGHFGLMGIQERTLLHGGQLSIRSTVGEGTEITVQLPYPA